MAEPLHALLWSGVVLGVTGLLFWPEAGFFWRWRRARRLTERVLIEDALKHLYNCEYRRQAASVESLAGALGISSRQSADLLIRIEARRLLTSEGDRLRLTTEGRSYALRIIRVHRLWEHYLAEETGVSATHWHSEAERREHDLSAEEVNMLAEQMGHPVYDPHGDPIPTPAGDIAPRKGQPLTALPIGEPGVIVHIEDEPEAVYAQLVAEGLHLGMRIEVTEVTPERIRFWGDGEELVLAPVFATNVSVMPVTVEEAPEENPESLSSLSVGEFGRVVRIARTCRGLERRRLMDLGIVPGTQIEAEMKSPSGDPMAYRVRGASIALRKEQASMIHIQKVNALEAV